MDVMGAKFTKLIADVLRIKEGDVKDSVSIGSIDTWDSLKHMELIVAIEQEYGISLTADEIVSMVNVGAIKGVLKNKGVGIDGD